MSYFTKEKIALILPIDPWMNDLDLKENEGVSNF
jgi:hypothetical protein